MADFNPNPATGVTFIWGRSFKTSMGWRKRLTTGLTVVVLAAACGASPQGPVAANPSATAQGTTKQTAVNQRCSGLTLTASKQSTITAGDTVTITATAAGCQLPDYRFVLIDPTSAGIVMQDWGRGATWTWSSYATAAGRITVRADARGSGAPGDVPDVSAYLEFIVLGTGSATLQACRLPVSGTQPGSGGFVQMPAGTFQADPSSNVPFRGQPDPGGLRRGYTYDPVHGGWLPVPRDWVMPDFSSYVYVGTEYPHASNMPALHMVKQPSGADTQWPQGDQLYGHVIALRPEGAYGAPGPEIVSMVDPTGAVTTVDQGHNGLFAVITPTALWASKWSTTQAGTYALVDVERIDPRTQAATDWFHVAGLTTVPIGVDGSSSPIIAAGTQTRNGLISATQIWIVPQASTGAIPRGKLIYSDPNHPLVILGSPIVSAGGIWIETDRGLWVDDSPAGPMRLVSNYSGYIAGGCLT
jgi:hypothetical protein